MSETPTANEQQWRFWAAVRAEMRATWWGRWRWLWLGLGAACIAVAVISTCMDAWVFVDGSYRVEAITAFWASFYLFYWLWFPAFLYALASWPAVWLGSDLLSLRFAGNPDPLREWRPAEFLARFIGRLAPLLGVVCATAFVFAPPLVENIGDLTNWLVAQTASASLYSATGLIHGAVAALLSSLSKRCRRGLVTCVVMFASVLPVWYFVFREEADWLSYITRGGWKEWISGTANIQSWPMVFGLLLQSDWIIMGVLLVIAILAGLWTWWIAARRYRRSRVSPDALERPASE